MAHGHRLYEAMDYPPSLLRRLVWLAMERSREESYRRAEWTRIAVNADSDTWKKVADEMSPPEANEG